MTGALTGKRILVVEDEYLIADDLKLALLTRGAEVIGPVPRIDTALALARRGEFGGAILDVNPDGAISFPIADHLTAEGMPHLFVTNYDGWACPDAYRTVPRSAEPYVMHEVIAAAERVCSGAA